MTIEKQELVQDLVHTWYWDKNINCARCTLQALGILLGEPIEEQTLQAAIGMHGAGGYRAQCGLVEGALMFIGIHFARKRWSDNEISALCRRYAEAFVQAFSSLSCRDLRPNGFQPTDPPHICEQLTVRTIAFAYDFIEDNG